MEPAQGVFGFRVLLGAGFDGAEAGPVWGGQGRQCRTGVRAVEAAPMNQASRPWTLAQGDGQHRECFPQGLQPVDRDRAS
ncbi:hypothetical protein PL81_10890 [Streptomyces sp. RSD-27]|nr:hypothetical protein PL81_10890 [Streptomyces sp. RSD-27]